MESLNSPQTDQSPDRRGGQSQADGTKFLRARGPSTIVAHRVLLCRHAVALSGGYVLFLFSRELHTVASQISCGEDGTIWAFRPARKECRELPGNKSILYPARSRVSLSRANLSEATSAPAHRGPRLLAGAGPSSRPVSQNGRSQRPYGTAPRLCSNPIHAMESDNYLQKAWHFETFQLPI
jgi:hypothetical protein